MIGDNSIKKKNKFLAFLLALLLGALGFHNFYIGRWRRGFLQFFLVIITFGAGILITLPWAWTEGFLILIGKYSLSPNELQKSKLKNDIIQSQEIVVNAKKEYFIVFLLLLPLLILSIFTMGIPILVSIIFYLIVGGLWNKITRVFIKVVLPIYATIFSGGKKFLIRFSEYTLHPTKTRAETFRATRKLSLTAIFVLLFLISLIAQSNISMVTEGNIPDAVICDDNTISLIGSCDDGSDGTICDSTCVLENSEALDRILEAYTSVEVFSLLMFSPFITILVAPILVLRFSSLSIVDKKTRSMRPIGEKANDLTNVGAGFGAIVLFFQTAWRISSAALENNDIMQGIGYVATILAITIVMLALFYPLIWIPMLKFTKSFESHVLMLDNSLVRSKGIEVHQLQYENNELRITPMKTKQQNNPNSVDLSINPSTIPNQPSIDAIPQNYDQHGFEWLCYNEKNYYRPIGQKIDWQEYE